VVQGWPGHCVFIKGIYMPESPTLGPFQGIPLDTNTFFSSFWHVTDASSINGYILTV
jgi:hypothetical protein